MIGYSDEMVNRRMALEMKTILSIYQLILAIMNIGERAMAIG